MEMNSWDIAPRPAKYRCVPANEMEKRMLELANLSEFDAISIGENGRQLAIVPLDNPDARRIALMIVATPALAKMCEAMLPVMEMIVEHDLIVPEIPGLRESVANIRLMLKGFAE